MPEENFTDFLASLKQAARDPMAETDQRASKKAKTTSGLSDSARMGNSGAFGYTEINKFEHCARLLQKSIRSIVEEAPNMTQLRNFASDSSLDSFARQEAKSNPLLQLVSKLKTLYSAQELEIFDHILNNSVEASEKTDKNASKQAKNASKSNPDPESDTEHNTGHNGLPPLPQIRNSDFRQRVFQHKSTSANKTYLNDEEIVLSHNERMEFLGDSVLNTVVTHILYKRFPRANEGQLSQIRSLLVSNKVIGEFSIAYGFDQKLRCNIDEEVLKTGRQKVFADVFEAYVGALAMERDYNYQEIENWLAALLANKIAAASEELGRVGSVDKEAKTELYSLIGTASSHPVYKVIASGNGISTPFKVQCVMEDELMGEGEAPSLKDAGLRAAMAALKNKKLLEKFGRKRLETDRSVSEVKQTGSSKRTPSTGPSPLPLVAGPNVFPNKFAKNEAYAYLGKNLGLSPEYTVNYESDEKRYKAELKVNEVVVSIAYDSSRKNAVSRAASVLLENKHLLHDIVCLVN